VEKLNGHIFHFFLVPDQRWKKWIHIYGMRMRKRCTYQIVIIIYFGKITGV
jgi:hypothetical protein